MIIFSSLFSFLFPPYMLLFSFISFLSSASPRLLLYSLDLFTGTWTSHQWLYHWRECLSLPWQPLTAYRSLGRTRPFSLTLLVTIFSEPTLEKDEWSPWFFFFQLWTVLTKSWLEQNEPLDLLNRTSLDFILSQYSPLSSPRSCNDHHAKKYGWNILCAGF